MKEIPKDRKLEFSEFLEICADNGLLEGSTAIAVANYARALGGVGALPWSEDHIPSDPQDFKEALHSIYPNTMTFDNFVTTDENYYACEIAHTFALIPRIWKGVSPMMVHASTGQGKTHLLAAMNTATLARGLMLNTVDFQIEYQHAASKGAERKLRNWIISHDILFLDDIHYCRGDMEFQKFIVSIMNRMPRETHGIITSSDVDLNELSDIYPSFYSRLTSGLVIKLNVVDLNGRRRILELFFSDTGIIPDEEVIEYIAQTFTCNVRQLKAAARMVLARMLGTSRNVTVDNIREIVECLRFCSRETDVREPDLSEVTENQKTMQEPSPYIVIDVEEREEPKTDETPVNEAAHKKRASDAERYKKLVSSANTVEKQTQALSMAIEKRIEQLTERGANATEIDRLRLALEFLADGKLDAAVLALKA